jgi:STAS-like domain of unknown function (DUF4325)
MNTRTINFVEEFTDCPGGRKIIHGEWSGEEFREKFLKPALRDYEKVVINMDGAVGFPSSFIDEAFGLLAEELGYDKVVSKLEIRLSDDDMAFQEIQDVLRAHKK